MVEEASSPVWSRKIGWRQGHVLPAEAVRKLGLSQETNTIVVVVSHDCDLANDDLSIEPYVEVIVGKQVTKVDQSLARTKNPRILHLEMTCDGEAVCMELRATKKQSIAKRDLAAWQADTRYQLYATGLDILRRWLAVRYRRAAFPDEFDMRLKAKGLDDKIRNIVKNVESVVSAVFFNLDPMNELSSQDGTPYKLTVILLYAAGDDPDASFSRADEAANRIAEAFKNEYFNMNKKRWDEIELKDALAICEEEITVAVARQLQQWRLEDISLKPNAHSATPPNL